MIIRLYLFQCEKDTCLLSEFLPVKAWIDSHDWRDKVTTGMNESDMLALWIEFDTLEQAALWKLTHL